MIKSFFIWASFAILPLTMIFFVVRCGFKVRAQAIWAMALLAASAKFLLFESFGGDAFLPDFPESAILFWNWLQIGAVFLAMLGVLAFPFRFRGKGLFLPLVAWTFATVGVYNSIKAPIVREIPIYYDNLCDELEGYRILQLGDLHISNAARTWRTREIVKIANEAKPDMICITGDMADGEPEKMGSYVLPLKNLQAKDGVYAIAGNHEGYRGKKAWAFFFEQCGIRFLEGETVIPRKGMAVAGVSDPAFVDAVGGKGGTSEDKPLYQVATNGEFRILLEHRPSRARFTMPANNVNLQLSGHTHGGIMPGLKKIVEWHNSGFLHGVYKIAENGFLHVTSGVGQWAGFSVRFYCPSEIPVLVLRRGRARADIKAKEAGDGR